MSSQNVRLIDQRGQVVATAQVSNENDTFLGKINRNSMSIPLLELFEEYEEMVNARMFSLLDEIEEKIEALGLNAVFDDSSQSGIADLQIFPKANNVSFRKRNTEISQELIDERTLAVSRRSHIQALVERPSESLSVEIKRWIDPDEPEGIATIVKAALALRNYGGGYIVIGFDNKTLSPDKNNAPHDAKSKFHTDKIQGLISRFASEPFQVVVDFAKRDGQIYPIIAIPSGVKTPVAAKSDLKVSGTTLISTDSVYVRSLMANNTPSTTRASWKDWRDMMEVCFDNRDADIGRFLRRHLGKMTPDLLRDYANLISSSRDQEVTTDERLQSYLQESEDRFQSLISERALTLPKHGSWEVALVFLGKVPPHFANREFLNLLDASNPGYTGWPVWLDSRGFTDKDAHPHVFGGGWEALIVSLAASWSNEIEFMRLDPKGRFYLRRALQDDVSGSQRAPTPMTEIDFGLPIIRSAEALAVGMAFAKAMGCVAEETQLAFAFRWKKLKGRQLTSWAQPGRLIFPGRHAYQDEVLTHVTIPLDTPLSALGSFVIRVVQPLFEAFDGFVLGEEVVEDLTRRLIERRL